MPEKIQNIYVCSNCDAQSPKWSGRCLECGTWGALQMQTIDKKSSQKEKVKTSPAKITEWENLAKTEEKRIKTNIEEIDRVLGGGIVSGSLILLSGEPGIGKSTIVAQIADAIGKNSSVIYASGEESASQVKNRLERLDCSNNNIKFISETNADKIIATAEEIKPAILIVDSIQTVCTSLVDSEAGSLNQIRASALNFLEMAKRDNITVILIGHVTKDGSLAGPKSLEHIVDTVIYLEAEEKHNYRILRATKNRFGSINELGIFEMTNKGFKEIKNPGAIFLETNEEKISGSAISCIIEGTRPFLVEVQALVTKTIFGYPQRKASGFDLNRLQVLSAVLIKRAKINLTNQDIILNVVGGLKINDPGLDLAVCLAISSSLLNQIIDKKTIILGEVGLGGEIRNISKLEQRLKEAEKLGFTKAIIPASAKLQPDGPDINIKTEKIKLIKIKNLNDIIKKL